MRLLRSRAGRWAASVYPALFIALALLGPVRLPSVAQGMTPADFEDMIQEIRAEYFAELSSYEHSRHRGLEHSRYMGLASVSGIAVDSGGAPISYPTDLVWASVKAVTPELRACLPWFGAWSPDGETALAHRVAFNVFLVARPSRPELETNVRAESEAEARCLEAVLTRMPLTRLLPAHATVLAYGPVFAHEIGTVGALSRVDHTPDPFGSLARTFTEGGPFVIDDVGLHALQSHLACPARVPATRLSVTWRSKRLVRESAGLSVETDPVVPCVEARARARWDEILRVLDQSGHFVPREEPLGRRILPALVGELRSADALAISFDVPVVLPEPLP